MKLTYANKVALNENAEIPNINKVTDDDMNEIKTVVNNNDDELITINTNLTNATTNSTTETVVGTWIDGKPIYRKVLEMTTPATANTWTDTGMLITGDFLGVGLGYVNVSASEQYPMNVQSNIYFYHNKNNGKLLIQCTDYYKSKEIKVAIYYTKITG